MNPKRATRAGLLTLAVLLIATGCAPASPDPGTSPSAPPSETAPAPAPVAPDPGPQPRLTGACAEFVDPAALQAFTGTVVAPLVEAAPGERLDPLLAAPAQVGAVDCQWTNGVTGDPWTGPGPDQQSARLRVLPDAAAGAAEYVALYGADPLYGEQVFGPVCFAHLGYCEVQGAIGGSWLEFVVNGVRSGIIDDAALLAGFRTLTDPLVERVRTAVVAPPWTPTATTPVEGCAALSSDDVVASVTGLSGVRFGEHWDGPGLGLQWTAAEATGALRCSIVFQDRDAAYGQVYVLPGGAWGVERFRTGWLSGGAVTTVPGADSAGVLRCAIESAPCRLDFAAGGDWIRVEFPPVPPESATYMPEQDYAAARDSIDELAAAIAGEVAEAAAVTADTGAAGADG